MSFIAAAVIGGGLALIGGGIGADAARSAGNTQADASRAGTAAQLHMFDTVNQQQLPYRQSGYNALNALNFGLGLPTGSYDGSGNPAGASQPQSTGGMPNIGGTLRMTGMTGANPVSSFGSGPGIQGVPTGGAAPTREQFMTPGGGYVNAGTGPNGNTIWQHAQPTFDQAGFDKATADYTAAQGAPAAPAYSPPGGMSGGQFTHQFNASDLNANLAPNYQFQLDQGLGATRNASNLSTGLVSGNTLKGINDYAQNYAGGAYQQAYNNYNQNQTNIFNRLSNIAGLGQTANQSTGSAATATGHGIANTLQAGGAGQAAGTVGQANAISGALNNAGGWYALSQANRGGNV